MLCAAVAVTAAAAQTPDPNDWPVYGRTAAEQHHSPLEAINQKNVERLGLAWYRDLDVGNPVSAPVEVDGVLYFGVGYSIIHAVDATTGKLIWRYDPGVPDVAGRKLRVGWGIRGIAYSGGKVFTGTNDGRLIAIDAASGRAVWTAATVEPGDSRFISGPPRVFDGKVIIGHGGADFDDIRGYVTTYDANTGKQLWRFYTVPGNPADGFENDAMKMAAETWAGEWWKYGGGGTVWNAITYDPEFDRIYLGVGNGAPWNRRIRSAGKGDNLFLASIVALEADTGRYVWHYQVNPGESWDYNAAMDIELATLVIDGAERKVLMHAPKNGFFYVIDRATGKLISAEPFAKVNWATSIDLKTGRPIERHDIRYQEGKSLMWPGPVGAHSWLPMSFNPATRLVYIPAIELPAEYDDVPDDAKSWRRTPGYGVDGGVLIDFNPDVPGAGTSSLLAWDPVRQKEVWRVSTPGFWNGGTITTAGKLVFQGQVDSRFNAYAADTGKLLWSYAAGAPVIAPPITYRVRGRQYVTVLAGMGTSGAALGPLLEDFAIDYRTQARRVLTFALDGREQLPAAPAPRKVEAFEDASYQPDASAGTEGLVTFARHCATCHGVAAIAKGAAPDLRGSPAVASADAFSSIVRGGALVPRGMPRFEEFTDQDIAALRGYLRSRAHDLRASQ
jgi:quinohemoprotein ethanol dehydrogenase